MNVTDEMWLGARAARQNFAHLMNYSVAFYGTAALQGWRMGVEAPRAFWDAMARTHSLPGAWAAADAVIEEAIGEIVEEMDEIADRAAPVFSAPNPTHHGTEVKPAKPAPLRAVDGVGDDLTALSGVGEKLAGALRAQGIVSYAQLAALDEAAIDRLNEAQPGFKALASRFDLVAQAAKLADG